MKHILISGGAGFIGTRLTRLALNEGHAVRILDNLSAQVHGENAVFHPPQGAEFLRGDITVRADWEKALKGIDTIVHLAAETGTGQSMYEVDRYYRVNVQGTALLFDVIANSLHSVSNVVLASSRSVYGEGAYICHSCDPSGQRCFPLPRTSHQLAAQVWAAHCPTCGTVVEATATREEDKLSPASIYAATKLGQETLIQVACRSMGIAHAILRFQNVFGEGQSLQNPYTGILSIFSTRIRLGLSLPIFEDGMESRDFVHVDDVANSALACVNRPMVGGAIINVGSGRPTSVLAVAQLLCSIMKSDIEPHVTGEYRVGDIRHNFADISALQRLTGFQPTVALKSNIKRFCEWVAQEPIPPDMLDKANQELRARRMMG